MLRSALFRWLPFVLLLTSCTGLPAPGPSARFSVDLVPGDSYRTTTKWFLFDVPVYPQAAVWLETPDGRFVGTLFVTAKAAKNGWVSAPEAGRPEALPVWNHRFEGPVDAVAGPTSSGETRSASDLAGQLSPGTYVVWAEVNRSYDYNASYPRDSAGVSGQPSLVYRGTLVVGEGARSVVLEPLGIGSADGSDGHLRPGLGGIDTALNLFSRLSVSVTG